jgi:hypothetical protein
MPATVDTLLASFPEPTLHKIEGRPTYDSISALAKTLNRNAASVQTENGGGVHGHLALTLSAAMYATLSPIPS